MEILNGIAPFISEAQQIGLLPRINFVYFGKLIFRFVIRWLRTLTLIILDLSWLTLKDLINFGLVIISIAISIVVISFIKSLKPRYDFHRKLDYPKAKVNHDKPVDPPKTVRSPLSHTDYKQIIDSSDKNKSNKQSSILQRISLVTRLNEEHEKLKEICNRSIATNDIKLVYRYLSWSQTHIDLETVHWLNQTLSTLWPTIKTIVNILIFNELLKPKDTRPPTVSRKLTKKRTNLGLYLSCRRKLDLLHKSRNKQIDEQEDEFFHRSAINILIFFIRITLIYVKQFINDLFVNSIVKAGRTRQETVSRTREINLKELVDKSGLKSMSISLKAKSCSSYVAKSKKQLKTKPKGKFIPKSAPQSKGNKIITINTTKLLRYSPRARQFRKNRIKLACLLEKVEEKSKPKEMVIEKLRLGESLPKVNGIKLVEESSNLMKDPGEITPYKLVADDSRIRLMSEISYDSDRRFQIRVDSIPIFGRMSLVKLSFQFRFLVTLNHTTTELNQDLKIFQTPDDVLFPAINYIQITLLDIPRIDWQLDRPVEPKLISPCNSKVKIGSNKQMQIRSLQRRFNGIKYIISRRLNQILDPVRIVNHSYFKYMVHTVVYFTLKWFQPFDIKIGDNIYLKTVP